MSNFRLILAVCLVFTCWASIYAQQRLEVPVQIDGHELTMPWSGGMNAPQFSNIDFNRDGIQDLISFDRQGNILLTYLRLPATGRWILAPQYAEYFPKLVDWVLVTDYDNDGVEDLFTSASDVGVPGVIVYKGFVENDVWSFTLIPDRDRDYLQITAGPGLTNLYVSWDDIPSIRDIDFDGDMDILSFEPGGSFIGHYKNFSQESGWGNDSLRYELEDFCWGKILENELTEEVYLSDNPDMCSDGNLTTEDPIEPRHSGSTILTLDPDFDGDYDAWVGDITSSRLVFLLNGLNAEEAWITDQQIRFPAEDVPVDLPYFVAAYAVDIDDDPEPEMLAAVNSRSLSEDRESVWRYDDDIFTDGPLSYQLTEKGWLQNEMIDAGSASRPAFADINGDDLPDLIMGGYHFTQESATRVPSLWYFRNTGTASNPYFKLVTTDYLNMSVFPLTFDYSPAFGDIDADGVTDLVVGEQNGKLFFYQNVAPPGDSMIFDTPVYPYMDIHVGVSSVPQIADINGDGLADLIVGERTGNSDNSGRCSNLNYFQNIGTPGFAMFNGDPTQAPNSACYGRVLFDIPIGLPYYSTPAIVSTPDGLILVTGSDQGELLVYNNLQAGIEGSLNLVDDAYGQIDVGNRSAPALADINGDGKLELAVGNHRGGLELWSTDILAGTTSIPDVTPWDKPFDIFYDVVGSVLSLQWKNETGSVVLYDVYGRLWRHSSERQFEMNLNDLVPGIYFVQMHLFGYSWTEKIIVRG